MKFLGASLYLISLSVSADAYTFQRPNVTLADVYGAVEKVTAALPWSERRHTITRAVSHYSKKSRASKAVPQLDSDDQRDAMYYSLRDPAKCVFPIEVMIVQDTTESSRDNFYNMRTVQLPLLVSTLSKDHPDSTFGMATFRDKPIWSLGNPAAGDYCHKFETPLSQDPSAIFHIYEGLTAYGGADPQENSMGSILATAQSETPGWSNEMASRLIILVTDAPPHFEGDGFQKAEYNMVPFSGTFDEANAATQCLAEYYPHPDDVRDSIYNREAYLAVVVYDADYFYGLPSESWEWFNNYIGQPEAFVGPLGDDSSQFWTTVAEAIRQMEEIECIERSTLMPQTSTEATEIPATTEEVAETTEEPTEVAETTEEPKEEPETTEAATEIPATTEAATEVSETTEAATEIPATTGEATEVPETTEEATEIPASTEAATEIPATTEAATEIPATTEAATEIPATTETATEIPATTETATEIPATTEAATEIPATTEAATEIPATTEAATEVPATTEAATEVPASTAEETSSDEMSETTVAPGVTFSEEPQSTEMESTPELVTEVTISQEATLTIENSEMYGSTLEGDVSITGNYASEIQSTEVTTMYQSETHTDAEESEVTETTAEW